MATVVNDCEIARLPEDLLSEAISRAGPRDAIRAAAVCSAFRAAADSDAVWSRFLPPHLPPLAAGELEPAPPSKKATYTRLCDRPVLLADGLVSMWLDLESGAKCYMMSARALRIAWGDTPRYWRWISLAGSSSRFAEAAELLDVCWLEIRGTMQCQMLSPNTRYAAYLVFHIRDENYCLDHPSQVAEVGIGENRSTRKVRFGDGDNYDDFYWTSWGEPIRRSFGIRDRRMPPPDPHAQFSQRRADGWMELEMGEFFCEGATEGEVSLSLMETKGGAWKKGLIVHGIEIRAKK